MSISLTLSNYLQRSGAQYQVCPHLHSRTSAETARLAHVPERLIVQPLAARIARAQRGAWTNPAVRAPRP